MLQASSSGQTLQQDAYGELDAIALFRGRTRVSLNVQDLRTGLEYRFVPEGPTLSEAEFQACLAAVEKEPGDWLIASGSLPNGVPDDAYAQFVLSELNNPTDGGGSISWTWWEMVSPGYGSYGWLYGGPTTRSVDVLRQATLQAAATAPRLYP